MIGRSRRDGFNPMRIILAGAAISALLTALSQGVALIFRLNQSLTFGVLGNIRYNMGTTYKEGPIIIVTLIIILVISKQLTILNLGESLAKGLGQNVSMIRGLLSFINDTRWRCCGNGWTNCFCRLNGTSHCSLYYRYRLFKKCSH